MGHAAGRVAYHLVFAHQFESTHAALVAVIDLLEMLSPRAGYRNLHLYHHFLFHQMSIFSLTVSISFVTHARTKGKFECKEVYCHTRNSAASSRHTLHQLCAYLSIYQPFADIC